MTALVGDIGGTHSRFGLVDDGAIRPSAIEIADDDDHAAFEDAVAAYLEADGARPKTAAFALAGPVNGRTARLTNRDWTIAAEDIERRFGFERVELLNDFVAQASALPYLDGDEIALIGGVRPVDHAPKAALGPGTGLGVSAVLPDKGGWLAVASEGGHVELAATTEREAAAFGLIRRRFGRVSAEMALAGVGLSRLHDALLTLDGGEAAKATPAEVSERAAAGDGTAREAAAMFLAALARFSGDVGLTFGARGGVYLCGGVLPKMSGLLDAAAFRAAFEAKAPHEAMMREIATVMVTSPIAGLIGCAAALGSLSIT